MLLIGPANRQSVHPAVDAGARETGSDASVNPPDIIKLSYIFVPG